MNDAVSARSALTTIGWTVIGLLVLALLLRVVGVPEIADVFGQTTVSWLLLLVTVGVIPALVWGYSLCLTFEMIGADVPIWKAIAFFIASIFLNSITPFGQVGGDPPSALLMARDSGTSFESGLVAIGAVGLVNRMAAILLGILGGAWYSTRVAGSGRIWDIVRLSATVGAVALIILAAVWVRRRQIPGQIGGIIGRFSGINNYQSVIPFPSREEVTSWITDVVGKLEQIASDPRSLAVVFLLSLSGQVVTAGVFWLAIASVGAGVPFEVVMILIPAGKIAGITPTPGGTGSAEVLLTSLLVAGAGLAAPVATAATLLYRTTAFWLPTVLGGLTTAGLLVQSRGQ